MDKRGLVPFSLRLGPEQFSGQSPTQWTAITGSASPTVNLWNYHYLNCLPLSPSPQPWQEHIHEFSFVLLSQKRLADGPVQNNKSFFWVKGTRKVGYKVGLCISILFSVYFITHSLSLLGLLDLHDCIHQISGNIYISHILQNIQVLILVTDSQPACAITYCYYILSSVELLNWLYEEAWSGYYMHVGNKIWIQRVSDEASSSVNITLVCCEDVNQTELFESGVLCNTAPGSLLGGWLCSANTCCIHFLNTELARFSKALSITQTTALYLHHCENLNSHMK
jgi:hypothetical protein